jgi:AraC family chitin signaling transcriptional activator
LNDMIRTIEVNLHSDDDWKTFEEQFGLVHSSFLQTLSIRCPDLTPSELRVSAMLKMNLASKEIARLLHISLRAVETYRYRVRAKLGLDTKVNLSTYLAGL